jgi:hypothetical protein
VSSGGTDAAGSGRILISRTEIAGVERRLEQGEIDLAPLGDALALDQDRAATTVVGGVAENVVILQLAEVRQTSAAEQPVAPCAAQPS